MEDRRTLRLLLEAGESRQLLLEAGSVVLPIDGAIEVRGNLEWLAETCHQSVQSLDAEEAWPMAQGGWLTISARQATQVAIIPPDCTGFWARVGRYLGRLAHCGANEAATIE